MFLRRTDGALMLRYCACLLAAGCLLTGCEQEMANQPRVDVMEPAAFEFESMEHRTPVPGTISRGQIFQTTPVTTGLEDGNPIQNIPIAVNDQLLQEGQKQFNIFCQHCHGPAGAGDGMVVQRGFPAPPSYHTDRLRSIADGNIFLTITHGHGRMPALGARIPIEDRWAIVAYVRALQLSQHVKLDDLTDEDRQALKSQERDSTRHE